ncbi:MAG: hypothetical protein ACHQJ4_04120 [Ignavibacteria bacterium]
MKTLIFIAVCIILAGCSKNNPVNSNFGQYSIAVTLTSPSDSASFQKGNITFTWRKPYADNVLGYQLMLNNLFYNAQDTFYTFNLQSTGTFEWMVYATVVDTSSTIIISSERRHIIIH